MKRPLVLFLCTGNSCRSQMAEGWLRHLADDRYEVFSAGIEPKGVNPNAVTVMDEVGIDISRRSSDPLSDFDDVAVDAFITVCDRAKESCPVTPAGARSWHWSFDDPPAVAAAEDLSGEAELDVYRRVRDEIKAAIEGWLDEQR